MVRLIGWGKLIAFGDKEYDKIYSDSAFLRFFHNLFLSKRVVFVGFGFQDPYLKLLLVRILITHSSLLRVI